MQAAVRTATPPQTSARRWVTVRAMKSLMRMNGGSEHESLLGCQCCSREEFLERVEESPRRPFHRRALVDRLLRRGSPDLSPRAQAVRSGLACLKPESKRFVAGGVLQALPIRGATELIS